MIATARCGGTIAITSVLAATSMVMIGCQDPRFQDAQTVRDARIEAYVSRHQAREAARPMHIRRLTEMWQDQRANRAEHLEFTLERIAVWHARNRREWEESADARAALCRAIREGRPEKIPQTWATLAY